MNLGPDGLSSFETFELTGTKLSDLGVGAWNTTWQWQYRLQSDGSWINFDCTDHRTFVVLEAPNEPWTQSEASPGGLVLPRVDALEFACRWAEGSKTRTEAAADVTRGIFGAGLDLLRYDRPGNGGEAYGAFYLTLFLDRLRGGEGLGPYVNCQDCANAVNAFANLLGCELWPCQVWDEDPETGDTRAIVINPLILIGELIGGSHSRSVERFS